MGSCEWGALSAAFAALFCRMKADSPVRLRAAAGPERAARNARDHRCLALRLRIRGRSCPRSYAEAPGERWARLRQHFPPLWCREGARERGAGGRGPCCHNSGICMHRTSCGSTVYRLSVRPFKRLSRLHTLENGKRTSQNKQLTNRPAHKPNPMEAKAHKLTSPRACHPPTTAGPAPPPPPLAASWALSPAARAAAVRPTASRPTAAAPFASALASAHRTVPAAQIGRVRCCAGAGGAEVAMEAC